MRTLRPNLDHFNDRRGSKTLAVFAGELGVDKSTLSRVLTGKAEPGPRFIACVLATQPHAFGHFFEVVDEAA